jgi:CDP-diacylglycerol--glycerol-3-phosphate 3-phosphatidyltransferase
VKQGNPRTTRLHWLPNAITSLRLAALPVLVYFVAVDPGPTSARAAWFFGAIGATDFIDGKLARRLGAESKFGAIADPFADRMLMAVGLVGLISLGRYSWPGPTIILVRDIVSVIAFIVLSRRGVALRVDTAGKISSGMAMFAVGLALLIDHGSVDVYFWIAVAVSIATFVNYAWGIARKLQSSGST